MEKLIELLDRKIEDAMPEVVKTTIRLVNIKSVKGDPKPGAPFGDGPRQVLDEVITIGREMGFHTTDYNVGVISAAMGAGAPDLGIWLHGDVVPEGEGWKFEPYDATEYGGCIIGRGAGDNKGQLAAMLHLLKIFKDEGITLGYNPAVYVGSDEESGMADLKGVPGCADARGFINVCTPPTLSLVPDGSFPVGYGGKGSFNVTLKSRAHFRGIKLSAGTKAAPFGASAEIGDIKLSASCDPYHGAHPPKDGNMITRLCEKLSECGLLGRCAMEDIEFIRAVSADATGGILGIARSSEIMGSTTANSAVLYTKGGCAYLKINVRYPIEIRYDEAVEAITRVAKNHGFEVAESAPGNKAYTVDKDSEVCKLLLECSNSVTGDGGVPYTMGGGTYAHNLPNAYVFGTSANRPPVDFEKGRGGVHGVDEAVSIDRLCRAMKIYARALLSLDRIKDNWR